MANLLELGLHRSEVIDVLDLRHVGGAQLAPLLRDEAGRWGERFRWDYTEAVELLQQYLESRVLPGFVAVDEQRRVLGYAFAVYEADKAVLGDIWAFDEGSPLFARTCEMLLSHMLEMLEATPGIDRIESQLLMFAPGLLSSTFAQRGFRTHPRLFMLAEIPGSLPPEEKREGYTLQPWSMSAFSESAEAIFASYRGHEDATINDQYQSVAGAERFLQNIIRFPGCGNFDEAHSLLLRDARTKRVEGVLLGSRVRPDTTHITQLCLRPEAQGKGLGAWMLRACGAKLKADGTAAISLTVTETNQKARALYERFGFAVRHRFEAMTWDR